MMVRFGRPTPLRNTAPAEGNAGAGSPPGTPPAGANGAAAGDGGGQSGGTPPAGNGAGAAPPVKVFTQEEVNRIAAQAREDGRRSASKATDSHEPKKSDAPTGAPAAPSGEEIQRLVMQALQAAGVDPFTQAARAAGYNDAQIGLARSAYDPTKAPDLGKWLGEWPTQVGMTINRQQATGAGAPTPTASNGAAPRKVDDMRDEAGLIDVFSLSPEQVLAMGPAKIREEFEKVVDRQRQLSGAPPIPAALRRK